MSRRITAALSLTIFVIFALAGSARAGGLYISEFGTSVMGTANAGAPAGTDDASTAIHNPAAMTRLDEHQPSSDSAPYTTGANSRESAWRSNSSTSERTR